MRVDLKQSDSKSPQHLSLITVNLNPFLMLIVFSMFLSKERNKITTRIRTLKLCCTGWKLLTEQVSADEAGKMVVLLKRFKP